MQIRRYAAPLLALWSLAAHAQVPLVSAPVRPNGDRLPALAVPLQHGFHVVSSFAAASSLTGWVLQDRSGKFTIVYTTPDGESMISGVLYSRNGDNLTSLYTDLYVPSADLNALWTRLEHARFVVSGAQQEPKSVIYVIMDPNCIYCHFLWLALKAYEAAGLQVHWVPVGFLHADSVPKAAALLTRGAGALQGLEENFDEKTESGAIEPIEVTAEMKEALVANQQIMRDSTMSGTPGIFYKDAEGHVRRKQGMPELYELPGITGLPVQPQTDPRLDRFNK